MIGWGLCLSLAGAPALAEPPPKHDAQGSTKTAPGGKKMANDDAGWTAAEKTVTDYFARVDGAAPKKVERLNAFPYFFSVHAAKKRWEMVLVHDGQVWAPHGKTPEEAEQDPARAKEPLPEKQALERASSYFRAIGLLDRSPNELDMQDLLGFFDALPHEKGTHLSDYATPTDKKDPSYPRVEKKGADLLVHLTYPVNEPSEIVGRNQTVSARWTLTITPDYKMTWQRREIVGALH